MKVQDLFETKQPKDSGWYVVSGPELHGVDGPHPTKAAADKIKAEGERVVYGHPKGDGTSNIEQSTPLAEAKRAPTDKGYYTPGYNTDTKHVQGTVADWIARLGATADDIKSAMTQARELPSFSALKGFEKTSAAQGKNGTFTFTKPQGRANSDEKYMVYANGQIRSSSIGMWNSDARPTRLKSPKPHLVAGSAVKSLIKIYDGAFKELAAKISKRTATEPQK